MNFPLRDFYFIRHGQTDWNLNGRCMGQQDIPLNATGINEIELAKSLFSSSNIQTICYSPLLRAKQTAEILQSVLNCNMVPINELKECGFGEFEGEFKGDRSFFQLWMQGKVPTGAESYATFMERAYKGIEQALSYPLPLIVAHGGIYWAVLKFLRELEVFTSGIPNGVPVFHQAPKASGEPWSIFYLDDTYDIEPFDT